MDDSVARRCKIPVGGSGADGVARGSVSLQLIECFVSVAIEDENNGSYLFSVIRRYLSESQITVNGHVQALTIMVFGRDIR